MKKIRLIAAAVLFAVLAISCNKEVDYTENAAGGYNFNFTIASSGFDNTKADATVGWTSGEKVYVFFKPEGGSLLCGTNYAVFTYDGENWSPNSFIAPGALGAKGKMSAIYVPYFAGKVPATDDSSWSFDCGDVYYSCASAADYEVKNETVYGVLSMKIPDGYVQFVVDADAASDGDKLLCNFVDAYDHVTLNGDMNFSTQKVADGRMVGHEDNGKVYFWGKWNNCTDAQCKWTLTNSTGDVKMEVTADNVTKNSSFNLTSMPEVAMVQLWENGPYWSTVNLGASKPEELGDYYAWGEIEPYYTDGNSQISGDGIWKNGKEAGYNWPTYKWSDDAGSSMLKYNYDDCKTVLEMADDAAHTLWGDKWRMPSATEFAELLANTTVTEEELNGIQGIRLTGKNEYSGNSIFLPRVGYRGGTGLWGLCNPQDYSDYWSSTLYEVSQCVGLGLFFSNLGTSSSNYAVSSENRNMGLAIRPVYADFIPVSTVSLNNDALSLAVGANETLTVAVGPTNATEKKVSWKTSDASVAYVNARGKVTALAAGTATITAYCGGQTATCTVTADYPYVDLGLSVNWATFNVGATSPEECGDYYAWGEIETYYEAGYAQEDPQTHWKTGKEAGYTWSTYKWAYDNNDYSMSKYVTDEYYGIVDGKPDLESGDDVASVKWGGNWRMPTSSELYELETYCTWTWTDNYKGSGVAGKIATSNKPGYTDKSIFLPAAGYRSGTAFSGKGSRGSYWSATHMTDDQGYGYCFNFGITDGVGQHCARYTGASVRPVYGDIAVVGISLNK